MKKRAFLIVATYLFLVVATSISADDRTRDELVARFLELTPPDTVSNAKVFETNGFYVKSSQNRELNVDLKPTGNQFDAIMIEAEDIFKVGIEKGRPMFSGGGFGIYHRSSGTPMLTAADRNGDGRIDILTYSVLSEDGETIREVVDYDANGQADLRIHFDEGFTELWHLDRWYRIENRDTTRGITVEGTFMEIQTVNGRPIVK